MSKDSAAAAAKDTPTAEELAEAKPGLSDEEKAALAAEDDQAGDGEGKGDEAKDADDPPQDADAAKSTDDDAAAGPSTEIPRGSAANLNLQPTRNVDLKAIGTRLNELDSAQADLDKKYDDEDMDAKEYLAQSRAITQENATLTADVREAQFAENANKSFAATDWQKSVNNFVAENNEFQTTIMQGALNAALNELYADDKNVGSSHNWYLQTAANAVRDQISPSEAAKDNPSDKDPNTAAVDAAKAAAKSASDAKGKLPKTLSDVPVADDAGTSKDKFADIDSLDGVELEAALSNMTKEQELEYLRAE